MMKRISVRRLYIFPLRFESDQQLAYDSRLLVI